MPIFIYDYLYIYSNDLKLSSNDLKISSNDLNPLWMEVYELNLFSFSLSSDNGFL